MTAPALVRPRQRRARVAPPSPRIDATTVRFFLPDPDGRYQAVHLYSDLRRPRDGVAFARGGGGWGAAVRRPDLHRHGLKRLEYAFVVTHPDGGQEFLTDPGNRRVAEGPFGARSVVELPGYAAPAWTREPPADRGTLLEVAVPSRRLRAELPCRLWDPPGAEPDEPLPLLLVHDGPEYADYAGLVDFLAHAVCDGRVPPLRAALLGPVPGCRDEHYSASVRYAGALLGEVLACLRPLAPQPEGGLPGRVIGMGASLGALAMLHAARREPSRFGGLFLQSGSYFRLRTDRQERGFPAFDRISRFVGGMLRTATLASNAIPVGMVCGGAEENLANNRAVAAALASAGYDVSFATHPDGHTFTAWRDQLDPHLADLLARALG